MKNKKRVTNILIAGTLTVLLLTVFLIFQNGNTAVVEANSTEQTAATELIGEYEADVAVLESQIEQLQTKNSAYQAQNEELRSAVKTLQDRENEYRAQIETANQTINELSAQSNSLVMGVEGFERFQSRGHEHNH